MNSDNPLVSVIIPAYNAERFIGKTLKSVLAQTYINIEVLVVDDGSVDRTAEIVASFAQIDNRVILIKQPNQGVAIARNTAIAKSIGEYIAPIDADDIWYPQKLEKQVKCFLNSDSSVGLVYTWSVLIDEYDAIIDHFNINISSIEGEVYKKLLYINFLGNASVPLIRRVCFEKVGGYHTQLKQHSAQGCEDLDIYLRIAEHYQFRVVREFLIGYRQVIGSMSKSYISMEKSYDLVMKSCQQRHPEIPNYIFYWSASYFRYYLARESFKSEQFRDTILYLYKAVELDATLLLHQDFYALFIKIIIKQLFKDLICQSNYTDWLNFYREKVKVRFHHQNEVSNINRIKIKNISFFSIYNLIWHERFFSL
ncbi:family 2 glycosyl transferase [Nostoc carneum NIES-2107]|nr:family 2 glycosyl transferase [Nostoc carneum NIES-2107]